MSERPTLNEQYYMQVSESIKNMFELTTRIDERVRAITKNQEEFKVKFNNLDSELTQIKSRMDIIDSQTLSEKNQKQSEEISLIQKDVALLKQSITKQESRWGKTFDIITKVILTITMFYILYMLGFKQ